MRLGRLALGIAVSPLLLVGAAIAGLHAPWFIGFVDVVCCGAGPVAMLLGGTAVARWRGQPAPAPAPRCAFVAVVVGGLVALAVLFGLAWPDC